MIYRRIAWVVALVSVSCQGAEPATDERFDWTIGTWEGTRRRVSDGSEEPMTMRVEPLASGTGQLRFLEIRGDDTSYLGAAVQQLDHASGRWVWQYMNSTARSFPRYEAEHVEADRSTWRSVSPTRSRESRLESERLSEHRWRRSMFISADGGVTWTGLFVDELERR